VNDLRETATNKSIAFLLTALVILSLSIIITQSKAQGNILVRLDPSTLTVSEGELFNISIYIENIPADPGVVGVEFKLAWNPAVLKGVNMTEVLFHSTMPNETEISENLWNLKHIVAEDYVWYAYLYYDLYRARTNGYAPISGNHTLAIITFNATSTGLTPLDFSTLFIGGPGGVSLTYELVKVGTPPCPGYVTVGNPPPTITIMSPQNTTYNKTPINLTLGISENASWIGYSLNGQTNVTITGNTTLSPLDGNYYIVVYANDTTGLMGFSDKLYFTVDVTPPAVSFTYSPEKPEPRLVFGSNRWEVLFNASASSDAVTGIETYLWDFGDGNIGSGIAVSHMYREPGNYSVTLNVTDGAGNLATHTITLTIPEAPTPWAFPTWLIAVIAIAAIWILVLGVYIRKTKKVA